jgi:hypothetical protein
VLHDTRMEAAHHAIYGCAILIVTGVMQPGVTRDDATHAGHGKTAFPAVFHLVIDRCERGIDEYGVRHLFGIRIARIFAHPEYHHAQAHADLRRGDACTIHVAHGVLHILDQRMQFRRIKLFHRRGHLQQQRIAHAQNRPNRHVISPFFLSRFVPFPVFHSIRPLFPRS